MLKSVKDDKNFLSAQFRFTDTRISCCSCQSLKPVLETTLEAIESRLDFGMILFERPIMIMMMIIIIMMWNMKISTMMSWPFGLVNNGHQMQKIALLELHISYEKRYYLKATLVFRYSENSWSRVSSLQRW